MLTSLSDEYNQLKNEYEGYQKMAEGIIQKQSIKIIELDKKLDMLSLMVEISQYINKRIGRGEIVSIINDIMIGILGVTYSSVYLLENRKLQLKSTNLPNTKHHFSINDYNEGKISKLNASIVNRIDNIYICDNIQIHSSILMPIYLKNNLLGVIVVEHHIYNYLNNEHVKLLTALTNQIAICIENNKLYNKIKQNSQKDFLTGLFNRNYFFSVIKEKVKNCGKGFAIVMIDIDDFKSFNDRFGHQYGDRVLRKVSDIIKDSIRKEDVAARYGGEEIIIYMYNVTDSMSVYERMINIGDLIKKKAVEYNEVSSHVTVSMGIAVCTNKDKDVESTIRRADMNLYRAKNSGKNKVVY
jgi:diguanylate cyclase (GGDEF)-like protein